MPQRINSNLEDYTCHAKRDLRDIIDHSFGGAKAHLRLHWKLDPNRKRTQLNISKKTVSVDQTAHIDRKLMEDIRKEWEGQACS